MPTDQNVPPEFQKYGPFTSLSPDQRGPDPKRWQTRQFPSGYTPGFSRSQIEGAEAPDGTGEPAEPYGKLPIILACVPLLIALIVILLLI